MMAKSTIQWFCFSISISSASELVSSLICFAGSDSTSDSSYSRFRPLGGIGVGVGLGSYSREAIV